MSRAWNPSQWLDSFDDMLDSELHTEDQWSLNFNYSLTVDSSTEERRRGWRVYNLYAFGKFRCSSCSWRWTSARVLLLFRYRLREGPGRGTVIMWPFGQACRRCPDDSGFDLPGFTDEEVGNTLSHLFGEIQKNCYEEEEEEDDDTDDESVFYEARLECAHPPSSWRRRQSPTLPIDWAASAMKSDDPSKEHLPDCTNEPHKKLFSITALPLSTHMKRSWHGDIDHTQLDRDFNVCVLVTHLSTGDPAEDRKALVADAQNRERNMYESAKSMEEYKHLVNDKLSELKRELRMSKGSSTILTKIKLHEAEKCLKIVRTELIKRVSVPILNLLIGRLLTKKVINDGEMNMKLERSEKARDIIDLVRRKGNKASSEMIDILQQLDPHLSEHLHEYFSTYQEAEAQVEKTIQRDRERMKHEEEQMRERLARRVTEFLKGKEETFQELKKQICAIEYQLAELETKKREVRVEQKKRELEQELRRESERREKMERYLEKMKEKREREKSEMEERDRWEIEEMGEIYKGDAWEEAKRHLKKIVLPEFFNFMTSKIEVLREEFERQLEEKNRAMKELEERLSLSTHQQHELTQDLEDLRNQVEKLTVQLQERERELEKISQTLVDRDRRIGEEDQLLKQRERELQNATKEVEESQMCQMPTLPLGDKGTIPSPREMEDHPVTAGKTEDHLASPHASLELQDEPNVSSCFSGLSTEESISPMPRSHSSPSLRHTPCTENKTSLRAKRSHSLNDVSLLDKPIKITPDIIVVENQESYRFHSTQDGLFQCSVTGLAFKMETAGDVTYGTAPWNQGLLAQLGKRPAGPLFDIKCPQMSVRQLRFPHCEILSRGGGKSLYVVHVVDEGIELIRPHVITESHVIINVTGLSLLGLIISMFSSPGPIQTHVSLFYSPPMGDGDTVSTLNVLLLPGNVVLDEVMRKRRMINGEEVYIEKPPCELIPKKEYTLSISPANDVRIEPSKSRYKVDEWSYHNYVSTFQVTLERRMKSVELLLRDLNTSVCAWESCVNFSAPAVRRQLSQQVQSTASRAAEDRLYSVRSGFISSVSDASLNVLLDKLLEEEVLNDAEREAAAGMRMRDEKARYVIDAVRRKGPDASSIMIRVLCDLDTFLSEHLGLV